MISPHQDAVPLRRALQDFLCLLPYRSSDSSIIEDHNDTKQKTKKKQAKRCRQISIFGFISVFRILMFFLHFFSLLSYVLKMKKNPALRILPPAAGRMSDIFHSRSAISLSVFILRKAISYEKNCLAERSDISVSLPAVQSAAKRNCKIFYLSAQIIPPRKESPDIKKMPRAESKTCENPKL